MLTTIEDAYRWGGAGTANPVTDCDMFTAVITSDEGEIVVSGEIINEGTARPPLGGACAVAVRSLGPWFDENEGDHYVALSAARVDDSDQRGLELAMESTQQRAIAIVNG